MVTKASVRAKADLVREIEALKRGQDVLRSERDELKEHFRIARLELARILEENGRLLVELTAAKQEGRSQKQRADHAEGALKQLQNDMHRIDGYLMRVHDEDQMRHQHRVGHEGDERIVGGYRPSTNLDGIPF